MCGGEGGGGDEEEDDDDEDDEQLNVLRSWKVLTFPYCTLKDLRYKGTRSCHSTSQTIFGTEMID